ncbi:DUF5908 family protein [Botryobacter ruber]|uniref:DUF5908 family protein n=1 Tax=Botryobacter ruber TaxID=2171629 RepID=UPI0013E3D7E2|nr:DUF5908 family protein [Botryobacter ruber]
MPIEIKELHIKASVVERKGDAGAQQLPAYELEKIKNELIRACVQEVLQVLEDKKER